MAWGRKRRRISQGRVNPDPFNAGEPIMPWDIQPEPEMPRDSVERGGDSSDSRGRRPSSPEPVPVAGPVESPGREVRAGSAPDAPVAAPSFDSSPRRHRADDPFRAGQGPDAKADAEAAEAARAIEEFRRAREEQRSAEAQAQSPGQAQAPGQAKKKGGSGCGCTVAVLVCILVFSGVASSVVECAADAVTSWTSGSPSDDSSFDYDSVSNGSDAEDAAAGAAVSARLDEFSQPGSEACDDLAQGFDAMLRSYYGVDAEGMGLDAEQFAEWAGGSISYALDGSYAYSDGTATVFADVTSPDFGIVVDAVTSEARGSGATYDDAAKQAVRKAYDDAVRTAQADPDGGNSYVMYELTRSSDGSWTISDESWRSSLQQMFWLYY